MRPTLLRRARRRVVVDDRGASAVEFALLFPIFLALCFGAISGGIVFSDKLAITQAVREAARYGATVPYKAGEEDTFLKTVRSAAISAQYGQLGANDAEYCVSFRSPKNELWRLRATDANAVKTTDTCPGISASGLPSGPHVLVSALKDATFNMLLYSFSNKIVSTSVARFEGTT